MLFTCRTIACLQDECRFILLQGDSTRGFIGRGSREARVIMNIVAIVVILEPLFANEAPAMIAASDIVASLGFQGSGAAVRTFFESPVFAILLITLADGAQELPWLQDSQLILAHDALLLHRGDANSPVIDSLGSGHIGATRGAASVV